MTVCALMVARDEADIIEPVLRHTAWHVDEILAVDHRSRDGTRAKLTRLMRELPGEARTMDARGLDGDAVWTSLAHEAQLRGHEWAVVVDADDVWHVSGDHGQRLADFLAAAPDDALAIAGWVLNHVPTADDWTDLTDEPEPNPLLRMGWRHKDADARKVAFRLRPDVSYREHNARYGDDVAAAPPGLIVRHFSIRSPEQIVRKIRNGIDAHDHAPCGPRPIIEEGWRRWRGLTDEQIVERYYDEFWFGDPTNTVGLVYDPAPVKA